MTSFPRTPELDLAHRSLATTLMGYALANPDTIRGRPHPAIVCDPAAGLRAFERAQGVAVRASVDRYGLDDALTISGRARRPTRPSAL